MIIYTGTFDIQNISTTVHVCFTCTFIEGSQLPQQSFDVLSSSIMSEYPTNGRQHVH